MSLIDIVRLYVGREPARLVAYSVIGATWAVAKGAALAHVAVPDDVTLAVTTVVTFLATELIRRFVYAPATVAAMGTPVAVEVAGEGDTV